MPRLGRFWSEQGLSGGCQVWPCQLEQVCKIIIIIITRPKPASKAKRLGLWGQHTVQAGTFWGVFNASLPARHGPYHEYFRARVKFSRIKAKSYPFWKICRIQTWVFTRKKMSEFVFELVDNCTKTDKVGNLAGVKYLAYSMSDSCLQRSWFVVSHRACWGN